MQRAGQSLIKNLKNLPLIHSYDSIQSLTKNINKSERDHDLVIASYVLGEIPSPQDRITIVRQLWDLTQDVLEDICEPNRQKSKIQPIMMWALEYDPDMFSVHEDPDSAILKIPNIGQVLVEPGTPHGFNIISQMRSYILWMEKRKRRKSKAAIDDTSKDLMTLKSKAFVVAPCAHDGRCPLDNTGKYCHFVQRLQRTTSQRVYKRGSNSIHEAFLLNNDLYDNVGSFDGDRPLRGLLDSLAPLIFFKVSDRDPNSNVAVVDGCRRLLSEDEWIAAHRRED
ncbi:hypothetical protein RHGRI_028402 [Rhododendron griersonianum]|uniref:Uncharacterized protein n=1 Tax=Rhododendron griersonianum TaxID=479676 RepID=A0AAV6IFR4_9ERIC|nr:hypothetical protein RHGRI_028402 [Rhododendron griersonianum]